MIAESSPRLAILNGGPGVGKTHTTAAIVRSLLARDSKLPIGLCAPTGKAAIRMTQLMQKHGVNREAVTIHRLLGVTRNGHDGDGWGFYHHAGNPLPAKVLCIDETSMLGTDLAASLFSAIPEDCLVLCIGDTGQLLPVGHGAPMRDIIKSGRVPVANLTEVRRNSGDLAFACQEMELRGAFTPSKGRHLPHENWWHFESRSSLRTRQIVSSLMGNLPGGFTASDIQVVCSLKQKSKLGCESLNDLLAPLCNPLFSSKGKAKFATGDKVICSKNGHYQASLTDEEKQKLIDEAKAAGESGKKVKDDEASWFVANGEVGTVFESKPGVSVVEFEGPDRRCRFAGGFQDVLSLAYAITTHKSQGSEWPIVIFPIDDCSGSKFLSSRELVKTAVSRSQVLTITVGQETVARQMLKKVAIDGRKTFLVEGLVG